jgi:purine-binding chemotaxis protein CheW
MEVEAVNDNTPASSLVIRAGNHICALPLSSVKEIFRPLPVESLAGAAAGVRGLALVRGVPVPIVDLATLLDGGSGQCGRFVIVKASDRIIGLSVDAVLGIREFSRSLWKELPSLLRDACPGLVEAIGALDQDLVLVLKTGNLVPEAIWTSLTCQEA